MSGSEKKRIRTKITSVQVKPETHADLVRCRDAMQTGTITNTIAVLARTRVKTLKAGV